MKRVVEKKPVAEVTGIDELSNEDIIVFRDTDGEVFKLHEQYDKKDCSFLSLDNGFQYYTGASESIQSAINYVLLQGMEVFRLKDRKELGEFLNDKRIY